MKKFLLSLIIFFAIALLNSAEIYSANEYFRSISSGNWNSTSTWEMSLNNSLWTPAAITPDSSSNTITVRYPNIVTVTANVSVDQLTIDSGTISIDPGVFFTVVDGAGNDFTILKNGEVSGSGIFQTRGAATAMNLRAGSKFNAVLKVNSGTVSVTDYTSPHIGRLNGSVTVDSGATLATTLSGATGHKLEIYGDLTNNGTVSAIGGSTKKITFKGSALINNGLINAQTFIMDTTSTLSGSGTLSSTDELNISSNGNITLVSDHKISSVLDFNITGGGVLNLNGFNLYFFSSLLELNSGATIMNSGLFVTQSSSSLNLREGSFFNAPLKVDNGLTTCTDFSPPYLGKLYGAVTVDVTATLATTLSGSTAHKLEIYGNVTNNGTLAAVGGSNKKITFKGSDFINNGLVSALTFSFDSTSTVSGSGDWSPFIDLIIGSNGNITLSSDINISPSNEFIINNGGILNPNTYTINFSAGSFVLNSSATIMNSGLFKTLNNVVMNIRGGSAFNVPLNVNTGTASVTDFSPPNIGRLYGSVTVDPGAKLVTTESGATVHKLEFYGNLTNSGTLTAAGSSGKSMTFNGNSFINNGTVSSPIFNFDSISTISGNGTWLTPANILNGANVNLGNDLSMQSVNINSGGIFNISNFIFKLSSSNPITQNGTFTNNNSTVEYNGSALQVISTANITYFRLKINNNSGTTLSGNVTVLDTLSVLLGDLDMNSRVLTISPTGYLTETNGNTANGTTGYITTTRNLNAPSTLNVGGFGAVLTTGSNLGSTEIKRGNAVQNGLNGGTSIARYFDIIPTNNEGLDASMVFKYDESELNGKPESSLKLFYSKNGGSTWVLAGGSPNPGSNSISVSKINSFSRWTSDTSSVSMVLNIAMEGFYNPTLNSLNMKDTLRAYFRSTVSPYGVVDSSITTVDSITFSAAFNFLNTVNGTYYIQTKHRNSIETWSRSGGETYTVGNTLTYNFTSTDTKAYGNNQIQVDAAPVRYAVYAADINQDGFIDISDGSLIDNDLFNFVSGYVPSDANGDGVTDIADAVFADNNGFNFVSKITP